MISVRSRIWNDLYFRFLNSQKPLQIFYGGSGSGKSNFLARRTVLDIIPRKTRTGEEVGNRNYLIVRNTARSIFGSTLNEIKKAINFFRFKDLFHINESRMVITCKSNGKQIWFAGLDDVEKLKSITPENGPLTDIWIEEASETSEPDYNQLTLRLRGLCNTVKRMTLSFNPISRLHWLRRRFFNGVPENGKVFIDEDRLIVRSTYLDNRFLAPDDIKRIEQYKLIDPYYWDVYGKGLWGVLGAAIFRNWEAQDLSGIEDEFNIYRNGLDFGFTNDPTALARSSFKDDTIYFMKELYERGLTNPMIAAKVRPIVGDEIVYCDSSEPKSIIELQTDPDNPINAFAVKKGRDSVLHGIQWLQQRKIIVDSRCQNMQNELSNYQWKKDKDGNSINQPVDFDNHLIDALRYSYESEMGGGTSFLYTSKMYEDSKEEVFVY